MPLQMAAFIAFSCLLIAADVCDEGSEGTYDIVCDVLVDCSVLVSLVIFYAGDKDWVRYK